MPSASALSILKISVPAQHVLQSLIERKRRAQLFLRLLSGALIEILSDFEDGQGGGSSMASVGFDRNPPPQIRTPTPTLLAVRDRVAPFSRPQGCDEVRRRHEVPSGLFCPPLCECKRLQFECPAVNC